MGYMPPPPPGEAESRWVTIGFRVQLGFGLLLLIVAPVTVVLWLNALVKP